MTLPPAVRAFAMAAFLPLLSPAGPARAQPPASPIVAPRIDRFDLDPPAALLPGEALIFRLSGSAGAKASVEIDGLRARIALDEVMTGIYEGTYIIRSYDQISVDTVVTGNLRLGKRELSTVLRQPLVDNPAVAASQ